MRKFIQTQCLLLVSALIVCAITLQTGCKNRSYSSPAGYDLGKPQKMELGKVLNEISGIAYDSDKKVILAISDSKAKVFEIHVEKHKLKDLTDKIVEPDADLEDLVKVGSSVFVLSSKGIIYEVSVDKKDSSGVKSYPFWSHDQNDFETLYYDPGADGLVMMCKTCESDKGKKLRSAYRFDLASHTWDSSAYYTISTEDVKKLVKNVDAKFDPSAAAIHPLNKRLYILSSAGNLLVVTDTRGKVIEGYSLNPDEFPQAEGIAFAPNGDMYVSNEGKYGKPTLQIFTFHDSGKNK
ncbi:MAG: SdiA-regulated domain-containing protein [Flavisolibacter sp.]